jgi:hypothetical protein
LKKPSIYPSYPDSYSVIRHYGFKDVAKKRKWLILKGGKS